jgi:hypothetical protein
MKVPKGKTVYIGRGKYKEGQEIPDSKVSKELKAAIEKSDKPKGKGNK